MSRHYGYNPNILTAGLPLEDEGPVIASLGVDVVVNDNGVARAAISNPLPGNPSVVDHRRGVYAFTTSESDVARTLRTIMRASAGRRVFGVIWFGPETAEDSTPVEERQGSPTEDDVEETPGKMVPVLMAHPTDANGQSSSQSPAPNMNDDEMTVDVTTGVEPSPTERDYSVPDYDRYPFEDRQLDADPSATCGHCGQAGHTLLDCVNPDADGCIHGCPWCNDGEHDLDECSSPTRPLDSARLYYMFVGRRARKPPLSSQLSWVEMVRTAFGSRSEGGCDEEDPLSLPSLFFSCLAVGFPWTRDYTRDMARTHREAWLSYDYRLDETAPLRRPEDPGTARITAILGSAWLSYELRGGEDAFWSDHAQTEEMDGRPIGMLTYWFRRRDAGAADCSETGSQAVTAQPDDTA